VSTRTDEPGRVHATQRAGLGRTVVLVSATSIIFVTLIGAAQWFRSPDVSLSSFEALPRQWLSALWRPWFFIFAAVLFGMQWIFPGRKDENPLSHGLVVDLCWFLLAPILALTVISLQLGALGNGLATVFGKPATDLVPILGTWKVAILAFVIADLIGWVNHWMHHKYPSLWLFHAVHHSQTEMNVFSDSRNHVIEVLIASTLTFIPAWFLGLDVAQAATLAIFSSFVSSFIHTNVRINLGPLRYIFISPQAHRIHHSLNDDHYNTNFGTVFSWWDYLFNTKHPDDLSYPRTGITDERFPLEHSARPIAVGRTIGSQLLYPFKVLAAPLSHD
jgi:sterol desaturase/sphingolipid hydroxylase (fatty acid hydroxylase superfamily)